MITPPVEAESGAIFDRDEFVRRNCGDLELSRDVAAIFIDHRPEYTESIRGATAACDTGALRQSAHKLKGAAVNLSLPLLAETAGAIESAAAAGDLKKTVELFPELELRFEQAVEAIRKQLVNPQEKDSRRM
jgi:HPt (histidine-containing phosphotransfer) domain-containing protein